MYRVNHRLTPTYLTDLCEQCSNTRLRSAWRGDYIFTSFASALCWQFILYIGTNCVEQSACTYS